MTKRVARADWYDKPERTHICPNCAGMVIPFCDGTNRSHCAKCGTVTHVSMIETDVPLFREGVKSLARRDSIRFPKASRYILSRDFVERHLNSADDLRHLPGVVEVK